jgi:hypothetical protein
MRCSRCLNQIASGAEAEKHVEFRRQPDRSVTEFGKGLPGGGLDKATGQLVEAKHSKCYWIDKKAKTRALATLAGKQAERAADPGYEPPTDDDWRPQDILEIEELLSGYDDGV